VPFLNKVMDRYRQPALASAKLLCPHSCNSKPAALFIPPTRLLTSGPLTQRETSAHRLGGLRHGLVTGRGRQRRWPLELKEKVASWLNGNTEVHRGDRQRCHCDVAEELIKGFLRAADGLVQAADLPVQGQLGARRHDETEGHGPASPTGRDVQKTSWIWRTVECSDCTLAAPLSSSGPALPGQKQPHEPPAAAGGELHERANAADSGHGTQGMQLQPEERQP